MLPLRVRLLTFLLPVGGHLQTNLKSGGSERQQRQANNLIIHGLSGKALTLWLAIVDSG